MCSKHHIYSCALLFLGGGGLFLSFLFFLGGGGVVVCFCFVLLLLTNGNLRLIFGPDVTDRSVGVEEVGGGGGGGGRGGHSNSGSYP